MAKNKRIKILLIAERRDEAIGWEDEFYKWFSELLKKNFALKEIYLHSNPKKSLSFLKKLILVIKQWNSVKNEFCPDKVIIYGKAMATIWIIILLVRLFRLKNEIIVFIYDFENFRPYWDGFDTRFKHFIASKLEKYCLINADKIIHKGLENELSFLPFYHKIKNKPDYLFREFVNPKEIKKFNPDIKLSRKDGEIHLVTVGTIALEKIPGAYTLWEFYPMITDQKLHLHIYMKADKKTEAKLKSIQANNKYFHFHGYLNHNLIVNEISKYDYGIYLSSIIRTSKERNIVITAMGYRIFEYITAHLPLICTLENPAHADLTRKYGIGICIHRNEIKKLKKMLNNNEKYNTMVTNINNAINDFSNASKFIEFIKV